MCKLLVPATIAAIMLVANSGKVNGQVGVGYGTSSVVTTPYYGQYYQPYQPEYATYYQPSYYGTYYQPSYQPYYGGYGVTVVTPGLGLNLGYTAYYGGNRGYYGRSAYYGYGSRYGNAWYGGYRGGRYRR